MGLLRIATTGTVAEYVIPALVEAFARRMPSLEIQVGVDSPGSFRELLRLRRADMTIGPDPISELGIECVPFLRYELSSSAVGTTRLPSIETCRHLPAGVAAGAE